MGQNELIYFTDPMCSWCYGFGPQFRKLEEHYGSEMPVTLLMGGLRTDVNEPMSEKMAGEIRHHWEMVQKASGLDFHFSFFEEHPDFIYNTEPACRAVVTAWLMDSGKMTDYQEGIQAAFYAQGRDPKLPEVQDEVAGKIGLDPLAFRSAYDEPRAREVTENHFAITRKLGVSGFPSIVLRIEERAYSISRGFMPFSDMVSRIDYYLEKENDPSNGARVEQ